MSDEFTTITVCSITKEEMKEKLISKGWHTWYCGDDENYWVNPEVVADPKIQNYTDYGMTLEDAFSWDGKKIKPSILNKLLDLYRGLKI